MAHLWPFFVSQLDFIEVVFFCFSIGFHQGCPLSHYLFIIRANIKSLAL